MKMDELVKNFVSLTKSLERHAKEGQQLQHEYWQAVQALGEHIAPSDMSMKETVAVWVRIDDKTERLIQVTKHYGDDGEAEYSVGFRGNERER